MPTELSVPVTLRIPVELLRQLEEQAQKERTSTAKIIRRAIRVYLTPSTPS